MAENGVMWRGRGTVQILDEQGLIMETESVGLCNVIPPLIPVIPAPTLIQLSIRIRVAFQCHQVRFVLLLKWSCFIWIMCRSTISIYLLVSSDQPRVEKAMATHSSTLAWKIPWMEEPGGLQSMGSQRVGHD